MGRQPPLAPPAPLMGGSKRDREKQKQLHQSRILSPGLMAACAVTLFSALSAQRVLRPQDDEQRTCDERAGAGECAESSLAMLRSCAASCGLPKSQRFPLDLVSAMGSLDWGKRTGWHAELEQKLRRSRPAGKCRIDDPNSNEPCRLIYWDAVQPLLTEAHQQHPRSAFAAQQLARSLLARVQVEAALALAAAVPKAPLVRWFAAQVLAHAGRPAESAALYAELFAEARVAALTDGRFAAALAPPPPPAHRLLLHNRLHVHLCPHRGLSPPPPGSCGATCTPHVHRTGAPTCRTKSPAPLLWPFSFARALGLGGRAHRRGGGGGDAACAAPGSSRRGEPRARPLPDPAAACRRGGGVAASPCARFPSFWVRLV